MLVPNDPVFGRPWWEVDTDSPFAPGESPFSVKGVMYRETVSFFDREFEGGFQAYRAQMKDPALREFMGQSFLASSLYDVMPVVALIHEEARALAMSPAEYLESRTEWQATRDSAGVYAAFLKFVSPMSIARRLPNLIVQILDFPEFTVTERESNAVAGQFSNVPATLAPWLVQVVEIYCRVIVGRTGGKDVALSLSASREEGRRLGIRMVGFEGRVTWS